MPIALGLPVRQITLTLVFCVLITPGSAAAVTVVTDDAASDSLWVYRDRFAASATHMTWKMKSMVPAATSAPSKEFSCLDKANDNLLKASLLLSWACDIMHMQSDMCEPARAEYEGMVLDRLRRTRDTLPALRSLLLADAHPGDKETAMEIKARCDDMDAAGRALDSILAGSPQGSEGGKGTGSR
jgi:hypothetical protein